MKSRIEKIKEILENNKNSYVGPTDIFKSHTEWTSEESAFERYSICKGCPELIKLTKQCKKCGCFMIAKTKLEHSTCPIGKW
jgi:hypothetical protein